MSSQQIIGIKRQNSSTSEPEIQLEHNSTSEARPILKSKQVVEPSQQLDSTAETTVKPEPDLFQLEAIDQSLQEPELQAPLESDSRLESLVTVERESSLFGSGWEYGQLLKEFKGK